MEGARLDMFGQEELLSEDAREGMGQSIVRDIWLGQLGTSTVEQRRLWCAPRKTLPGESISERGVAHGEQCR
jgi:hypothetical protein